MQSIVHKTFHTLLGLLVVVYCLETGDEFIPKALRSTVLAFFAMISDYKSIALCGSMVRRSLGTHLLRTYNFDMFVILSDELTRISTLTRIVLTS